MNRTLTLPFAVALLGLAACSPNNDEPTPLEGAWTVDNAASHLAYVTVKAGDIAETNEFTTLTGSVSAEGAAVLEVDLASVSTGIDIRDERMREVLFNVVENPTATITAQLDPAAFSSLAIGETTEQVVEAELSLIGVQQTIDAELAVTRTAEDRVIAVTTDPILISTDRFGLSDGLAQLQELAGLPSITPVAPVTFAITFER